MRNRTPSGRPRRGLLGFVGLTLLVCACSASGSSPATGSDASASPFAAAEATARPSVASSPAAMSPVPSLPASVAPTDTTPEAGGGTTSGDVPDNAVFLPFRGGSPAFSIQYVEGWQVDQRPDGVVIRDKDSSETVAIVARPSDVAAYVASTDLPSLQAQPGFKLGKQDTVKVGGSSYVHLRYHLPAPPDPVTGKRVPSTVDRYYVPGPGAMAVVSLSTPDGVDNVDAFRQMVESFKWS